MIEITDELKKQIQIYINILNGILEDNADKSKTDYHELRHWIPNCIECLQFATDNENLLEEKPSLLYDTIDAVNLLYGWLIEEKAYDYIILKNKFGKVYTPEEIGNAFKILSERFKENNESIIEANYKTDILNTCGCNIDSIYRMVQDGMSTKDALQKIADMYNKVNNIKQEPNIDHLKKQIKYSKNPLEVKMLNKKLNQMYKEMKRT